MAVSNDEEGRVAAYFPDDFKQYVVTQLNSRLLVDDVEGKNISCGWVFWSREDDQYEHPPNILDLKKKIKDVLRNCVQSWLADPTLLQFWAPTKTMEGRSYLTTQNQPFALATFHTSIDDDVKGICGYRMISKDYNFYMDRESSDEQLGVPGRVFNHGLPECTPNVEYYSIKEYPLRDHALRCRLKLSWAIPLFDPSTHLCVGVLEIVSTKTPSQKSLLSVLPSYFKEVGLESSISSADHLVQNVEKSEALDEIIEVLKVVRAYHGLPLAQAWAPCNDIFHVIHNSKTWDWKFDWANIVSHLRKGQGVVGRAFSSPNVLFCKDVTQLSIIDYPLAHYARHEQLGGYFAICLQSSCTGNDIYVLECFMPPSNKDYHGKQQTGLRKILKTMKKNFRTLKLASVQMSQTTKSLPRLEPLQSGGEMTQLDSSIHALNNGSNVVSAERSNIDVTCSQEKGTIKKPKRVHNKTGVKIGIPLKDILQNSKKHIGVAANNLGGMFTLSTN